MEVEGDSNCDIQQWVAYWVIFAIIGFFELLLADILMWLPFWPYLKLVITFWLVFPYFNGASYVYLHAKSFFLMQLRHIRAWFIPSSENCIMSSDDFLLAAERYINYNGVEALKTHISQDKSRMANMSKVNTDLAHLQSSSEKKVVKEWTCTPCLVSTIIKADFLKHLDGKKHKAMETRRVKACSGRSKKVLDLDLRHQSTVGIGISLKGQTWWCKWYKPDIGWTKLNTDGSLDLENARLGGLLRDHMGKPLCAFVSKAARDGIFSLELWAIWRGLVLAKGLGIKAVWVESDSESVVKVVNKEIPYPLHAHNCLIHIWKLLKQFDKHRVTHSWREANRAADHLSKMNLWGKDVVLWPVDFPQPLSIIIREDAEGKLYLRRL